MNIRSQNTGAWLPQNSLYIRQINVDLVPGEGKIDKTRHLVMKKLPGIHSNFNSVYISCTKAVQVIIKRGEAVASHPHI